MLKSVKSGLRPADDELMRAVTGAIERLDICEMQADQILTAFKRGHSAGQSDMLSIISFMDMIRYDMDKFTTDTFLDSLDMNMPVLVNKSLLNSMYEGAPYTQNQSFVRTLDQSGAELGLDYVKIPYKTIEMFSMAIKNARNSSQLINCDTERENPCPNSSGNGEEKVSPIQTMIVNFISANKFRCKKVSDEKLIMMYPEPQTGPEKRSDIILIRPRALKLVMMKLTSKKGRALANYFLNLEEFILTYMSYQNVYQLTKSDMMIKTTQLARREAEERGLKLQSTIDSIDRELKESNGQLVAMRGQMDETNRELKESKAVTTALANQITGLRNDSAQQTLTIANLQGEIGRLSRNHVSMDNVSHRKREMIYILKNMDYNVEGNNDMYEYCVVRCQKNSKSGCVNAQANAIDGRINVIAAFGAYGGNPNAGKLWTRFSAMYHANLDRDGGASNWFNLHNISETQFLVALTEMDANRS